MRLASGNFDGIVCVWDTTTGALLLTIPRAHQSQDVLLAPKCTGVHFSPRDKNILTTAGVDLIHMWDVVSGKKIRSIEGRSFAVFSPDGRWIATQGLGEHYGEIKPEIHLFDSESGAFQLAMVDHDKPHVSRAAFSPDGDMLVSMSADGFCRVSLQP